MVKVVEFDQVRDVAGFSRLFCVGRGEGNIFRTQIICRKIFSDKFDLCAVSNIKQSRWVYEGSGLRHKNKI